MMLTEQEKNLVLNFRAEEALKNKPIKFGYLKEDVYSCSHNVQVGDYHFYTKNDIENHLEKVKNSFSVSLKKGTEFVCFSDNGRESWYDNICYGFEDAPSTWASKFLDIQTTARKRKSKCQR